MQVKLENMDDLNDLLAPHQVLVENDEGESLRRINEMFYLKHSPCPKAPKILYDAPVAETKDGKCQFCFRQYSDEILNQLKFFRRLTGDEWRRYVEK